MRWMTRETRSAGPCLAGVEVMVAYMPRLLTSDIDGTVRARLEHIERIRPGTCQAYADKPVGS
jgi:hypothetical protein